MAKAPVLTPDAIREIAMGALVAVAGDPKAPAAARAASGRTLLEALGVIGRLQDLARLEEKRSLAEMTATEVEAEINRLAKRIHKDTESPDEGPEIDADYPF